MKKIIYTANIGGYDTTVNNKQKGWDYKELTSLTENLSEVKNARKHKIMPSFWHYYDISVWIDANIKLNININTIIRTYLKKGVDIVFVKHGWDCIYREAQGCLNKNKDSKEIILEQMDFYRKQGYPEHNGMIATGFMIRRHSEKLFSLMKDWWKLVKLFSHRDQLSFNYALWKNPDIKLIKIPYSIYKKKELEIAKGHNK